MTSPTFVVNYDQLKEHEQLLFEYKFDDTYVPPDGQHEISKESWGILYDETQNEPFVIGGVNLLVMEYENSLTKLDIQMGLKVLNVEFHQEY